MSQPLATRDVALEHHRQAQAFTDGAAAVAAQMWAEVDPERIVDSWAAKVPEVTAVVSGAQLGNARQADEYVGEALAAQDLSDESVARTNPAAFSGQTAEGGSLLSLLAHPAFITVATIADGVDVLRAMRFGRDSLDTYVRTEVADAGRLADQVSLTSHPAADGYIRQTDGNPCARCLILSGRFYRWNRGFARHPRCGCVHVPAGAGARVPDPRRIYDRMTPRQRRRAGFSRGDMEALEEGADLNQVINARRGTYVAGTRRLTREGTTRRGFARARLGPGRARLTPDQIFVEARSRDEALRLLHDNGYILGLMARPSKALGVPAGGAEVRAILAAAPTAEDVSTVLVAELRRITGREIRVDLKGSAETAREHAEGVLRVAERYPQVAINEVVTDRLLLAYAEWQPTGRLVFSDRYSLPERRQRYLSELAGDGEADWHPFDSPVGMAVHEMGHALDVGTLGRGSRDQFDALVQRHGGTKQVSGYAEANTDEFIAEAFADAMMNGPRATPLSRAVLDVLDAEYARTVPGGAVVRAAPRKAAKKAAPAAPARDFSARWSGAATADDALRTASVSLRTAAERTAYADYVSQYRFVNGVLRENGGVIPAGRQWARERRLAAGLDSAMARGVLPDDIGVYRIGGTVELPDGVPRVGAEWTDFGYTSTSVRPKVGARRGETQMRIVAPRGTRAVRTVELDVDEVLLDRGSRFRVVKVDGPDDMGVWHLGVEVVPAVVPAKAAAPAADLSRMTVPQLRALAKERGVTGYSRMPKAELLDALGSPAPVKAAKKAVPPAAPAKTARKAAAKKATPAAPDLTGARGLSDVPAVREVQIENRIRQAYADAVAAGARGYLGRPVSRPGAAVRLSEVRDRLRDLDPAEVEAALRRMGRADGTALGIDEAAFSLTPADRAAAIRYGGEQITMFRPADPSLRPLPAAPAKKATAAKAAKKAAPAKAEPGVAWTAPDRKPVRAATEKTHRAGPFGEVSATIRSGETIEGLTLREHTQVVAALRPSDVGAYLDWHGFTKAELDLIRARQLRLLSGDASMSLGANIKPTPFSKAEVRELIIRDSALTSRRAPTEMRAAARKAAKAAKATPPPAPERLSLAALRTELERSGVQVPPRLPKATLVDEVKALRGGQTPAQVSARLNPPEPPRIDRTLSPAEVLEQERRARTTALAAPPVKLQDLPQRGAAGAALRYYQRHGDAHMLGLMRRGRVGAPPGAKGALPSAAEVQASVDQIRRLMDDSVLTEGITVFRGMASVSRLGRGASEPGSLVGRTFRDKGFVSTSADRRIAMDFMSGEGMASDGVLMEVRVPAGTRAIQMSNDDFIGKAPTGESEREILLQDGLRFRVVSDEMVADVYPWLGEATAGRPYRHIVVEVIP